MTATAGGQTASIHRLAGSVVLIGPPGAGCTTVGRALADLLGVRSLDLGTTVADALGTSPDLALVTVPEARYREAEAAAACEILTTADGGVVSLGSGCLEGEKVRRSLTVLTEDGGHIVMLTASLRRLASRNGLDAPRSIALGGVRQEFVRMLRAREDLCRDLADGVVDTSETTPHEAAALITALIAETGGQPRRERP